MGLCDAYGKGGGAALFSSRGLRLRERRASSTHCSKSLATLSFFLLHNYVSVCGDSESGASGQRQPDWLAPPPPLVVADAAVDAVDRPQASLLGSPAPFPPSLLRIHHQHGVAAHAGVRLVAL